MTYQVISVIEKPHKITPFVAVMIMRSGRSWWQARYSDGKILSEWSTLTTKLRLPVGKSGSSRWEDISKKGMVGLRLLCPNGTCGELEAPEGHRFIQMKVGGVTVNAGGSHHFIDAHIIGVVVDSNGSCFCRAWDYRERRLLEFYDNIFNMKYRNIGRLSLDVQGVRI